MDYLDNDNIEEKEVKTRIKDVSLVELRRNQIIEASIKLFTEKGFHETNVRNIAEEAGLTMGTLYNYVASKQDIIFIVYDYLTKVLRKEMRESIEQVKNSKEKMRAAFKQNLRTIHKYQDQIMFMYNESRYLDKESLQIVLQRETEYIELFEELLEEYLKDHKFDKTRVRVAADILSYLPAIITLRRWSLRRRYDSLDVVMENIVEFVFRGLEYAKKD